ncbi:MAG: hypothetical protein U0793_22155 [Gemmataceae bacterium]
MNTTLETPRLVFPDGFGERDEWEMESKGYVHAFLERGDGSRYQVMFIDPVRLAQDIEATLQSGQAYYYECAQVVVPEVTVAALTRIIPNLVKEGFLDRHPPACQPPSVRLAIAPDHANGSNRTGAESKPR